MPVMSVLSSREYTDKTEAATILTIRKSIVARGVSARSPPPAYLPRHLRNWGRRRPLGGRTRWCRASRVRSAGAKAACRSAS